MISVQNINFSYNAKPVLKNISFEIPNGCCVAILGNNGEGKSTLIKCMNRINPVKEGAVMVSGNNVLTTNRNEVAKHIAYVAQKNEASRVTVYALTDLLICGHCGTPYRRVTWSKNGKKKIVWRCISRLDYGKKYCDQSPSIEESVLQTAVADSIRQIVMDESGQSAMEMLKLHIEMYFSSDDENSTLADELRMKEITDAIMETAKKADYSEEMVVLVDELNEIKAIIAKKKARQTSGQRSETRVNEVLAVIDSLKSQSISYSNQAVRQLIECIRVISDERIQIVFKGGIEKSVALKMQ